MFTIKKNHHVSEWKCSEIRLQAKKNNANKCVRSVTAVDAKLVASGLRNFYFTALYYNLIWIRQVNYHDFCCVCLSVFARMKRKLDRHETESAWNWRTQPISAQFNVNVIVLWESWLIAIVHYISFSPSILFISLLMPKKKSEEKKKKYTCICVTRKEEKNCWLKRRWWL